MAHGQRQTLVRTGGAKGAIAPSKLKKKTNIVDVLLVFFPFKYQHIKAKVHK